MYHIGKVVEIFSSDDKSIVSFDSSVQVFMDMWDENMMSVSVDSHLSKSIKKDDVVLVDYTPTQTGPRMIVVKILRGELAKRTWKRYKEHFEKMRTKGSMPKIDKQSYVG